MEFDDFNNNVGIKLFEQKLSRSVMSQRFGLVISRDMSSMMCYVIDEVDKESFNIK